MDQRLAVEAELSSLAALGLEPGQILQFAVHAIQCDQSGFSGCRDDLGQEGLQRPSIGGRTGPQLRHEVVGPDHYAGQRPSCSGDGADVQHPAAGLDHRPQPDRRPGGGDAIAVATDGRGMTDLGGQHALRSAPQHGREVVSGPGPLAVDPHDHFLAAEAAFADGPDRLVAGRGLGLRRHGVLQVQDHHVAGQGAGLVDGAGVGGRNVERAAPRSRRLIRIQHVRLRLVRPEEAGL